MGRTVITIPYTKKTHEEVGSIIARIMEARKYKLINYNQEVVYKKGTGIMTAMHYVKTECTPEGLVLSGWVCPGVGSLTVTEMELKGFMACLPKSSVKKVMKEIENAVRES